MKTADARRLAVVLGLLVSGAALAGPHYVASRDWGNFIWVSQYLDAGQSYTFETNNLTGSAPDTVLHVLRDRGGWSQVAANDDCPGGSLRSCVTFTAPDSGYYYIWVHPYSDGKGGTASLYRNGTLLLTNNPFGGVPMPMTWTAYDTFRVAGTTPAGNDYMLFLLRSTTDYLTHDDDSGPKYYPALAAATSQNTGSERVVVGRYPGSTGPALFVHDVQLYWASATNTNDNDRDGLSNGLEQLIGLSANNKDTDGDTVPDGLELLGNDGFSFSEWGTPALRDLYVEIDWMEHPTNPYLTRKPYPELVADAAAVFTQDSDSSIRLHAFIDGALPWSEVVCFDGCSGGTDFYSLKQSSFSTYNPERRPYFHYAVWGYRHTNNTNCSSGLAELLGNDIIISLACWSDPTSAEQRGTFIHELGHNLSLSHNGNDVTNQYSNVHNSVMNYRYQFSGVAGTGRHTYSFGTNACAACESSPKAACADCRNGTFGCGWFGCGSCDCDVNEWGTLVLDDTLDPDYSDGASPQQVLLASTSSKKDKGAQTRPAVRVPHEEPPAAVLRERARTHKARLAAKGLQEGRDFRVSADGTRLYTTCP